MTKEEIFQAFLSNPAVLSTSKLIGDLRMTNIGVNGEFLSYQNQCNKGFGLIEAVSDGGRDVFGPHDCGNAEFFEENYPTVLEDGMCPGWTLTGFDISTNTKMTCFVHLYWLRDDPRIFDCSQEVDTSWDSEWYQENCVSLMGSPRCFRFIVRTPELWHHELAYLVEYREDEHETATYVEVAEIIQGKKVRTFRRWFTSQNEEDAWEVVNYYVPAD